MCPVYFKAGELFIWGGGFRRKLEPGAHVNGYNRLWAPVKKSLNLSVQSSPDVVSLRSFSNDDGDVNTNDKRNNRFRLAKEQLCTCITLLFCTFLCRHCSTTTWKFLISRFVENVDTRQRPGAGDRLAKTLFFFSWTSIQSFRFQLQKKMATFDELKEME